MRTKLIAILVVQVWMAATRPLWAQSSAVPYLAFNRGASVCVSGQTCDDKAPGLGSPSGMIRGFEDDYWMARDPLGRSPDGSRLFVLSASCLIARLTPHVSARLAPDSHVLKFWRGTVSVVVSF